MFGRSGSGWSGEERNREEGKKRLGRRSGPGHTGSKPFRSATREILAEQLAAAHSNNVESASLRRGWCAKCGGTRLRTLGTNRLGAQPEKCWLGSKQVTEARSTSKARACGEEGALTFLDQSRKRELATMKAKRVLVREDKPSRSAAIAGWTTSRSPSMTKVVSASYRRCHLCRECRDQRRKRELAAKTAEHSVSSCWAVQCARYCVWAQEREKERKTGTSTKN